MSTRIIYVRALYDMYIESIQRTCSSNRIQPHSYVQRAHVLCGLTVLNWTPYF
mgnify:CR=1|jgi:hypothetical protein